MKKYLILYLLLSVCTFASSGVIPPIGWEATGYQYNMTLYAQVLRQDGTPINQENSILAVFDAYGECRGATTLIEGPNGLVFSLLISSNAVSEPSLCFKVLDAATGEVYLIQETVDFFNDLVIPENGIVDPMVFHVRSSYQAETTLSVVVSSENKAFSLAFAIDDNAGDVYSATKDVRTTSSKVYIVGSDADGQEIALQKSVRNSGKLVKYQLHVNLDAGEKATFFWNAFNQTIYMACLYPDSASPMAFNLEKAGEYTLSNTSGIAKTYSLAFVFATDDGLAVYKFSPGWNLVAFPFTPEENDARTLLTLKPFGLNKNTYSHITSITPNVGYWFFTAQEVIFALARKEHSAMLHMDQEGWNLIGVPTVTDSSDLNVWQWINGRFQHIEKMKPGVGYWLYTPKR